MHGYERGLNIGYIPKSWFVTTRPLSTGTNPVFRFAITTVPVPTHTR